MPAPQRVEDVLQRVRGEFLEMPGLHLTLPQAQRLWGMDRSLCESVLGALVDARFLARTPDGAYVRYDSGSPGRIARSEIAT